MDVKNGKKDSTQSCHACDVGGGARTFCLESPGHSTGNQNQRRPKFSVSTPLLCFQDLHKTGEDLRPSVIGYPLVALIKLKNTEYRKIALLSERRPKSG